MNIKDMLKNKVKLAKVSIIIIFLATIRCIAEPLRLEHYSTASLQYEQAKPFIIGGLIASVSLFAMVIMFFYSKFRIVMLLCITTIVLLLVVKAHYNI